MGMKFSQLTAGAALGGTEIIPMVQGGLNYRTTPAAVLTYALTRTLNTWTGTQKSAGGFVASGTIGTNGIGRTDAQAELQSASKTLLSLYTSDYTNENGITWGSDSTTTVGQQQVGVFSRFVNSVNTAATFKSVYGVHVVGGTQDTIPFQAFSNNALKLIYGDTSDAPWTTAPVDNSVQFGHGTTSRAGLQVVLGLVSGWVGLGAQNLTLSTTNYALLIKADGTATQLNAVTGGAVNAAINNVVIGAFTGNGLQVTGSAAASAGLYAYNATATPANGTGGVGLRVGTDQVGWFIGAGVPTFSAPKGSEYTNTTATTTTTRKYINTDGGTTWTNFTTAA